MVREVSEIYIEVDVTDPRRPDYSGESEFSRQKTGTTDLVDAFSRYVSTRTGSFERLLTRWVSGRLKAGLPVNLEDPDSLSVPPRLKKALQAGFERARANKRNSK
jgi:hypothetical protein